MPLSTRPEVGAFQRERRGDRGPGHSSGGLRRCGWIATTCSLLSRTAAGENNPRCSRRQGRDLRGVEERADAGECATGIGHGLGGLDGGGLGGAGFGMMMECDEGLVAPSRLRNPLAVTVYFAPALRGVRGDR